MNVDLRTALADESRSDKREEILAAATERFGRDGYEDTKWADIAADVGVGPTALYHYFESKQHCLFVIMDQAIEGFRARFEALTAADADPLERARCAVMADCFELSEHEVQRNRVLVAEQGLLSAASDSPREEEARQAARARTRDLEFAWASFLSRAMQQGAIPTNDPRLLTRAILGLYNSIWHWYRPNGIVALDRIAEFFTDAQPRAARRRARRGSGARGGGMSFFERYFAALDGPDPHSLAGAGRRRRRVLDPVGRRRPTREPPVHRRPRRSCARFIDAGDTSGWAHHVLSGGRAGDVEFALGETRYDDGERIGTFLAVAQLDADGRMVRYMVARSPRDRVRAGDASMTERGAEAVPTA